MILASKKDPAAKNIVNHLLKNYDFRESQEGSGQYLSNDIVLIQTLDSISKMNNLPIDADEVIVASRHESESGKPSLTTHAPGKLDSQELAIAAPFTLKAALRELGETNRELKLGFDVSLEATHHGPTGLDVPVTFVEIGSSPKQWGDPVAGEAAACAVMAAAGNQDSGAPAIGLGGTHYARKHTKVALQTDVGIGHILPKYQPLNSSLLEEALKRTKGENPIFALDWNGLNSDLREAIQKAAEELGVKGVRDRDILREKKA